MMGMRAKKNCMAMLLIVGGIVAVFLAHRKVAEKITEEEYQRFLDGEVPAMKENGKTYFLEDLSLIHISSYTKGNGVILAEHTENRSSYSSKAGEKNLEKAADLYKGGGIQN